MIVHRFAVPVTERLEPPGAIGRTPQAACAGVVESLQRSSEGIRRLVDALRRCRADELAQQPEGLAHRMIQ
jgi:hypothetical protein